MFCGGHNTLSVTNSAGSLKYHCFRLSCGLSGGLNKELSIKELKGKPVEDSAKPADINDFVGWGDLNLCCLDLLAKNNSLDAYKNTPNKFYYDKIKDRLIFIEYNYTNKIVLATGRTLRNEKPKWYKYVALQGAYYVAPPIIKSDRTFIVEDSLSACSMARLGNAIALCGTSYNTYSLLRTVVQCSKDTREVVICLDPDAQIKALKIAQDLRGLSDLSSVKVVKLSNDAKYLSYDTLKKELDNGH